MPRRGSLWPSSAERADHPSADPAARPASRRRRAAGTAVAGILAATLLAAACARQGLPPGGPQDTRPPYVLSTEPDSGATRVSLDAEVAITFSEPMNPGSVLDWVLLSPPRDFGRRSWSGNTFRLAEGEGFDPDVTTTVVVGTGCRDLREGNPMAAPYLFLFSTGDSLDHGRIEGRLLARGQAAHGTMVWAIDAEAVAARTDTLLPDYLTQTAADSTFTLIGLKPGRRYLVFAHFDANRDREYDRSTEFLAAYPDTLWLDPAAPTARGVAIDFRDPRAPGSIAGTVIDSTATAAGSDSTAAPPAAPDSIAAAPALRVEAWRIRVPPSLHPPFWAPLPREPAAAAEPDTAPAARAAPDTLGAYELRNLAPGLYRVEAYLDRGGNGRYDAGEPAAVPADSVAVTPLDRTEDVDLIVR